MVRPDPRVHGDITGLPVGLLFADRADLYDSGLHGTKEAGIFGTKDENGAFSIVLNQGYEDDEDKGDVIIYTGEGKGKPEPGQELRPGKNTQQGPQSMKTPKNAALKENKRTGFPVRVIRGPNGSEVYSPRRGYRYDGLYNVVEAYMETGKAGFKMCRFELRRCTEPSQEPLPTHIMGDGLEDKFWSPGGLETLLEPELRRARRKSPESSDRRS
ncbi:PUA-like domain-containing protein [Mycena pura]|uniref:PUA-like domain-containing protein n=1 Tax=Mycena pura TaxID=153505 RepID=A0AAD6VE55_9AGAR|nr:PUA-like domain-containing protein [Mycena pura]